LGHLFSPLLLKKTWNPFQGIEIARDLSRQEEAAGIGFGDPKNILKSPPLSLSLFQV
jgi:hypothetical protein